MQQRLVSLARSAHNPFPTPKDGAPSIITDLLIYGNPDLAKFRFDVQHKNLDHNYVDQRSQRLGKLSATPIDTYAILGNASLIHHGAASLFYSVANETSIGALSPALILEKIESGYANLPTLCRNSYTAGYEEIKEVLSNKATSIGSLRAYAGKLTGLACIFV